MTHDIPNLPSGRIVCLCGSTRYREAFTAVNRLCTLAGAIVLAPGVFAHAGDDLNEDEKQFLDLLHLRKIDLADEVIIVMVDGYVGSSTRHEITYAMASGTPVSYFEAGDAVTRADTLNPPFVT